MSQLQTIIGLVCKGDLCVSEIGGAILENLKTLTSDDLLALIKQIDHEGDKYELIKGLIYESQGDTELAAKIYVKQLIRNSTKDTNKSNEDEDEDEDEDRSSYFYEELSKVCYDQLAKMTSRYGDEQKYVDYALSWIAQDYICGSIYMGKDMYPTQVFERYIDVLEKYMDLQKKMKVST
jgi:hypothetical protein